MKVTLLRYTPDPEGLITQAARLCYSNESIEDIGLKNSTPEQIENFINRLSDMGHFSPMEHSSFTFGIEGVSRITEIQLIRKRIASYSIKSGRYVNRKDTDFVMPPKIENSPLAEAEFLKVAKTSEDAYNAIFLILMLKQMGYQEELIKEMSLETRIEAVADFYQRKGKLYKSFEKIAIEDARYVHLQSLTTSIIVTMNASSLKGFFSARGCKRAQWEIREMSNAMLEEARKVAPTLFRLSGPGCMTGKCPEGSMSCGDPFPKIKKKVKE